MKFARQKYKWIKILCFIMLLSWADPAMASSEGGASITIFYHGVTSDEKSIVLPGAEFTLYKIGDYIENEWRYNDDFSGCTASLKDMSASGQLEIAKEVSQYAKEQNIKGVTQKTGDGGYAAFSGLENGLYMIVPGEDVSCEGGVFRSAPFLVSVPETDERGNIIYDIKVEPKNEWVPGGTGSQDPNVPTTEQENNPGTSYPSSTSRQPGQSTSSSTVRQQSGTSYSSSTRAGQKTLQTFSTAEQKKTGSQQEEKSGILYSLGQKVKTGDDTEILLFAGIMVASMVGILFSILQQKNKKKIE